MTDATIVLRKLASLRDHAARVRRRRPSDLAQFRGDVDLQDALSMSLLVAVQEAHDVALHMAAEEMRSLTHRLLRVVNRAPHDSGVIAARRSSEDKIFNVRAEIEILLDTRHALFAC